MNIEEKILWGQKKILNKKLYPRTLPPLDLLSLGKIICFLGGRRTGKTSLMFQLLQGYLTTNDYTIDQIIHLDFSELDNHTLSLEELHTKYHHLDPLYVFDEIQELPHFERSITWLYNQGATIFISGSNSHLLGQEISTKLRGRVYDIYNDVLDFGEFLIFKEKQHVNYGHEMNTLFEEYLVWGGYPEVVLQNTNEAKSALLQSYLDVMIYRDIIDRYSLKNEHVLNHLIKSLIVSNTKHININRLYNTYKSLGYSISKNTIYEYFTYLHNVFFVSSLTHAYRKTYFDKVYLIDNGFMNLYTQEFNLGQKFENVIYKFLKKKHSMLGYNDQPIEIDFTDTKQQWQVCRQISEENYLRETAIGLHSLPTTLVTTNYSSLVPEYITQTRYDTFLLG